MSWTYSPKGYSGFGAWYAPAWYAPAWYAPAWYAPGLAIAWHLAMIQGYPAAQYAITCA